MTDNPESREVMALLRTHFPIAIPIIQRQIKMAVINVRDKTTSVEAR